MAPPGRAQRELVVASHHAMGVHSTSSTGWWYATQVSAMAAQSSAENGMAAGRGALKGHGARDLRRTRAALGRARGQKR